MSDKERDESVKLLRTLTQETNRTLASHREELERINRNLAAAHQTVTSHAEAIEDCRKGLRNHAEVLRAMQEAVIALWKRADLGEPPTSPSLVN